MFCAVVSGVYAYVVPPPGVGFCPIFGRVVAQAAIFFCAQFFGSEEGESVAAVFVADARIRRLPKCRDFQCQNDM